MNPKARINMKNIASCDTKVKEPPPARCLAGSKKYKNIPWIARRPVKTIIAQSTLFNWDLVLIKPMVRK